MDVTYKKFLDLLSDKGMTNISIDRIVWHLIDMIKIYGLETTFNIVT